MFSFEEALQTNVIAIEYMTGLILTLFVIPWGHDISTSYFMLSCRKSPWSTCNCKNRTWFTADLTQIRSITVHSQYTLSINPSSFNDDVYI